MCNAGLVITRPAPTTAPWQLSQRVPVGCDPPGGRPWQVPQASCVPSTVVHVGAVIEPPAASVPPWQYALLQRVPSNAGRAPSAVASAPQLSSAPGVESRCPAAPAVAGTTWHWLHAISACHPDGPRCWRWAPTPRELVADEPSRSTGGAAFPPPPWHESHPPIVTSTVPLMCNTGSMIVRPGPTTEP
jgi:hypothetical protein